VPSCDLRTRVWGAIFFSCAACSGGYSRMMHPMAKLLPSRSSAAAPRIFSQQFLGTSWRRSRRLLPTGLVSTYLVGGREAAEAALERARVAGFSALAVTIDTAQRHARA